MIKLSVRILICTESFLLYKNAIQDEYLVE